MSSFISTQAYHHEGIADESRSACWHCLGCCLACLMGSSPMHRFQKIICYCMLQRMASYSLKSCACNLLRLQGCSLKGQLIEQAYLSRAGCVAGSDICCEQHLV